MRATRSLALAVCLALAPRQARADELPPVEVARPPLPKVEPQPPPPWRTHLEVGAHGTLTTRPLAGDSPLRFPASPGLGLFVGWQLLPYLRASFGASYVFQQLAAPPGAIVPGMSATGLPAHGYTLDVHVAPMLALSRRVRVFASVGMGWTRIEMGRVPVADASGPAEVRERALTFYEVPVGVGATVDLFEGRIGLHGEASFGPAFAVDGTAHEPGQVIDAAGRKRDVRAFDGPIGTATQRLGLSVRF